MLITIRFLVEVTRNAFQSFIPYLLDVLLHSAVVGAPLDSIGTDSGFLSPQRYLVGMLVVEIELVDQGLLDCLVKHEVTICLNHEITELERRRKMTVDIDRPSIQAITGEVGNIMATIKGDASQNRIECPVEH